MSALDLIPTRVQVFTDDSDTMEPDTKKYCGIGIVAKLSIKKQSYLLTDLPVYAILTFMFLILINNIFSFGHTWRKHNIGSSMRKKFDKTKTPCKLI